MPKKGWPRGPRRRPAHVKTAVKIVPEKTDSTKPPLGSPLPDAACRITQIATEAVPTATAPQHRTRYRITVSDDAGAAFIARIDVDDFSSHDAFRKALSDGYGADFVCFEASQDWAEYTAALTAEGKQ